MHRSSPDEEEVEEKEEEGEQPERYQVFTDGTRRKDKEEQDSFMEPLMDLTGLINRSQTEDNLPWSGRGKIGAKSA